VKQKSHSNDFVFTSKDGKTKLPHEIEKYNSSTGELVAHIRVPTVSDTSNAFIYIYYGNPNATDQQDIINVWKGTNKLSSGTTGITHDYAMVQHLNEDPTDTPPEYLDSTENNNDGTETSVTRVAAKIGDGAQFNATTSKIDVGSGTSIDNIFTGGGFVGGWINPNSDGEADAGSLIGKSDWNIQTKFEVSGLLRIDFAHSTSGTVGVWRTAVDIPINKDTYVIISFDKDVITNTPTFYINGEPRTIANGLLTETTTPTGTFNSDTTAGATIGNVFGQTATFDGEIDEVRMASIIPPNIDDLVKTEFNNQNDPSAFVTVSALEQYVRKATEVAQDIVDSANDDMPILQTTDIQGLIAHLSFEHDMLDSFGTNNGTVTGTEKYVRGRVGRFVFDFTGTNFVTLANPSNFNKEHSNAITISFWMKTSNTGTSEILVFKRADINSVGYGVYLATVDTLVFELQSASEAIAISYTGVKRNGTWNYYECTYGGGSNRSDMQIFENGSLVLTGTAAPISTTIDIDESIRGITYCRYSYMSN